MKREHFSITIHDEKGLRQFRVSYAMRKALRLGSMVLGGVVLCSFLFIYYLNSSIENTLAHKKEVEQDYATLKAYNSELLNSMHEVRQELKAKEVEYEGMSDKLESIETMIGLAPAQEITLMERIELTRMSSEEMARVLQYVPNGSPVEYRGITSKFGNRTHPIVNKREYHPGTDLKAAMKTPVHATADGVIEFAALHKSSGYGRLIIIHHNYGFRTYFGHLKEIKVKSGQFVKKGELIALSGSSGLSNGPHLHYEVRFLQQALNPYWFIKWDIENYTQIFEKEKKVPWHSLITAINQHSQTIATKQPSSHKVRLSQAN